MDVSSDNGPQFCSQEFPYFAKLYHFRHVTSSPHFFAIKKAHGKMCSNSEHTILKSPATLTVPSTYIRKLSYSLSPLEHDEMVLWRGCVVNS